MAITREDYVEQSVQSYVKSHLFDSHSYPETQIEFLDAFDDNMFGAQSEAEKNYIAAGFDFDNDGAAAEMGSDLIRRIYTFEFFVVGISAVWGRNIAHAIKFSVEHDGYIPVLDIEDVASAPNWPEIGRMTLVGASANRIIVQDPAPWQRHLWVSRIRVEDEYHARLT